MKKALQKRELAGSLASQLRKIADPRCDATSKMLTTTKDEQIMQRPIKVLFLSANPTDTAPLHLDEEIRSISQRIRRSEYRRVFDLRTAPAMRATDLPYELMDNDPSIVHFSGHGSSAGELMFLHDDDGRAHPIPAPTLARVFKQLRDKIVCVILNACYSEVQAQAIVESLPCVIGMSRAIPDSTAIAFSAGFYEALAFGKSIADAFDLGLTQIELGASSPQGSSNIPRLLVRAGEDPAKMYLIHPENSPHAESDRLASLTAPPTSTGRRQQIGNIGTSGASNVIRIYQSSPMTSDSQSQKVGDLHMGGSSNKIDITQE